MQILFAKCIDNQHFLISMLPSVLLIWQEDNVLANQHFTLTKQQIRKSATLAE